MFDATMNLTSFAVCTHSSSQSHIYRILINYISSRISLTTSRSDSHHKQFQMHFRPKIILFSSIPHRTNFFWFSLIPPSNHFFIFLPIPPSNHFLDFHLLRHLTIFYIFRRISILFCIFCSFLLICWTFPRV